MFKEWSIRNLDTISGLLIDHSLSNSQMLENIDPQKWSMINCYPTALNTLGEITFQLQ